MAGYTAILFFFINILASSKGAMNVTDPSGRNAATLHGTLTLRCTVSPLTNFVVWYTPPAEDYVCFCRDKGGRCEILSSIVKPTFCTLDISQGQITLTIFNVTLKDEGIYMCRHGFAQGRINISIQDAPAKGPVIGETHNGSMFYVRDGQPQSLACLTEGGRPRASLSWNCFSGTVLDWSNETTTKQQVTWTAARAHNGQRCTCQADHPVWTNRRQFYVTIEALYPPTSPTFTVNSQPVTSTISVIEGRSVSVTCKSTSNPPPVFSWNPRGLSPNDSVLTLTNVSTHGRYTCTVTNTMTPSQGGQESGSNSSSIHLHVLYPPSSPAFTVNSQPVSSTVYVIEGNNVSVSCSSTSNPSSVYSWSPRGSSSIDSVLTLTNVSKNGVYTCTVTNTMTPTQREKRIGFNSGSVSLNILYPPRNPVLRYRTTDRPIISSAFNVVRGDSFIIYCNAEGNPTPSYQWTNHSANNNKLTVTSIQKDSTWTCTATNEMVPTGADMQTGSSTATATAHVLYRPSIPILTYQNSSIGPISFGNGLLNVLQGKSFIVTCDGSDSKPMSQYTWSGFLTSPTGTLRVDNLQRKTSSTCTASNVMERTYGTNGSKSSSQSMTIDVLYPPIISNLTNGTAIENANFSKECLYTPGNPHTTNIKWIRVRDNTIIQYSQTLTIGNVSRDSAGAYMCTATNKMQPTGENAQDGTASATFILIVYYKPQMPINITIGTITHNTAVIQWVQGFNGGLEQTFFIEYWPSSENDLTTIQQKRDTEEATSNSTLIYLTPGIEYTVNVYAENSNGRSTKSEEMTFFTKEIPNTDTASSEHSTRIIAGVTGGLAASLIVVVIVLMIGRKYPGCSTCVINKRDHAHEHRGETSNHVYDNTTAHTDVTCEQNTDTHNAYETLNNVSAEPRMYDSLQKTPERERTEPDQMPIWRNKLLI